MFPNPLIPGFQPRPEHTRAETGGVLNLAPRLESMPGIPVLPQHRLASWTHIGNVAPGPKHGSAEADRGHRRRECGRRPSGITTQSSTSSFTVAMKPARIGVRLHGQPTRRPVGSDGVSTTGIRRHRPGLGRGRRRHPRTSPSPGSPPAARRWASHRGIQAGRVDLGAQRAAQPPALAVVRATGLKVPGGGRILLPPRRRLVLMIARAERRRGHKRQAVAGASSPEGQFGTGNPGQTGGFRARAERPSDPETPGNPADLGGHAGRRHRALVLLGVRPLALTQSFSQLGRETFITAGLHGPGAAGRRKEPVLLNPREALGPTRRDFDFAGKRLVAGLEGAGLAGDSARRPGSVGRRGRRPAPVDSGHYRAAGDNGAAREFVGPAARRPT